MVRILHLEDNALDASLIRYTLEDERIDCEIRVVDTRGDFVRCLEEEEYDVVFADYTLPKFTALDALEIMRERGIRTPVLLISGTIGEEFAVRSLKAGATDYVLKDHLTRLGPAVRRALAEYDQRRRQAEAEAEIQRQSELFEVVEKMAFLGTFTWDLKSPYLYWSPGMHVIYETDASHLRPTVETLLAAVHVDDRQRVTQALEKARVQGGTVPLAFRLLVSGGRIKHVSCRLDAIPGPEGPEQVVGVLQDVTRTKQAELALQASEENYRRLNQDLESRVQARTRELHQTNASLQIEIDERRRIEAELNNIHHAIDDVIWSFNLVEGRISYLSPSAARLFGLSLAELDRAIKQRDLGLLIHAADQKRVFSYFSRLEPGQEWDFQFRVHSHQRKDIHIVRIRAKLSLDAAGKPVRIDGIATDITERVRAEDQLKASEQRYRTLFNSAPDAIISMDISSGAIIAVNRRAVELLGTTEDRLLGTPFAGVFPLASRETVMTSFGRYLHENRPFSLPPDLLPLRLSGPGGRSIPVEASPSKFWLEDRQVLSCFFRDVRQRLEQEEAIRDLQEKYRLISENTLDIILLYSPEGILQYISPSVEEVLGIPPEGFLGKNLMTLYTPQPQRQARILERGILPLTRKEVAQTSLILPIFDARGQLRLFDVQTRPINGPGGQLRYLLSRCRDVTDRERAYQQVKEREVQYRLISENMSDLITTNSPKGELLWVSPSSREVLGWTPEEMQGRHIYAFIHPEDQPAVRRETWRLLRRRIETMVVSYRLRHRDDSYLWVETIAKRVLDTQGRLNSLQTSTRDISERKQAEEETRRALMRERELNELKSHFVSVASHQFRTPLTVIQSNMQLLRSQVDKQPTPVFGKIVDRIEKETRRLTNLMNDVLILGRLDAHRLEPRREEVNPVEVVRALIREQFAGQVDGREVEVRVEGEVRSIQVDPKLFEHTLSNLLSNAFKYSPGARAPILTLVFETGGVSVRVQDFGIGIPAEDQAHLFQSFYRARNTRSIQGTGLGLAIAREFTHLNGGALWFESQEGQGATFVLNLPYTNTHEVGKPPDPVWKNG